MLNVKISDAFTVMYKDLVNNPEKRLDLRDAKYLKAKKYIETLYPELDVAMLEFIAMYTTVEKNPSIMFIPAKKGVCVRCLRGENPRYVTFNDKGVIVKDESTEYENVENKNASQKGE